MLYRYMKSVADHRKYQGQVHPAVSSGIVLQPPEKVLSYEASCKIIMIIGYLFLISLQISFFLLFAIVQHIKVFIPLLRELFTGFSSLLAENSSILLNRAVPPVSSKILLRSSSDSSAVFLRVPACSFP